MQIDDKRIRLLYIDDENNNLLSFQASFRRKYQVFTASSAAEGLKLLNEVPDIHVVIADQRMPKSTGVEFFNIVRKAHPDPMRILLTGYSDIEALIDAINKGEIYRYFKKPWDEAEIQTAIHNAYEMYVTKQQLKKKVHELEKINHDLNRFVYSTSHDLRSPLASITGILNLAKLENSVEDPNDYLSMIDMCVKRMDTFIQKTIEYYKSVRVEDERTPIDFKALLDENIAICKLQKPEVIFSIKINQSVPFISDAFRLSVILDNLISNAVKYQKPSSDNPEVCINVEVDKQQAMIEIQDNGIGIVEDHLNNIFKMFFRSSKSVNGFGIGLYIVKEALQRIGGEISVRSTYGVGTTFCIMLPNFIT